VVVANHEKNLLTRLVDVRYINAFVGERAAYSRLGSVLCVCGSLAFYRADVVLRHLDAFLGQTFLGQVATVGDDRHLTNWCLTEGRVVLAENAVAHTAAPQRWGHYIRQQTRWGRSFFRESLWVLRHRSPRILAWWLTLVELTQWLVFSTILVYIVVVHPMLTGSVLLGEYLLFVAVMAMARSVRYFDVKRVNQSRSSRLHSFLVSPVYGYLAIFVMTPLRLWSLLTLRRSVWGTRGSGVEVRAPGSSRPLSSGAVPGTRTMPLPDGAPGSGVQSGRTEDREPVAV
jgi:hyaluronan synthase